MHRAFGRAGRFLLLSLQRPYRCLLRERGRGRRFPVVHRFRADGVALDTGGNREGHTGAGGADRHRPGDRDPAGREPFGDDDFLCPYVGCFAGRGGGVLVPDVSAVAGGRGRAFPARTYERRGGRERDRGFPHLGSGVGMPLLRRHRVRLARPAGALVAER